MCVCDWCERWVTCNWKPTLMFVHEASSSSGTGRAGCSCFKNKVFHAAAIAAIQYNARAGRCVAVSAAARCGRATVKVRQIVGVVRVVSMVCEMCTDRRNEWHFDERHILIEQIAFVYVHRLNCSVVDVESSTWSALGTYTQTHMHQHGHTEVVWSENENAKYSFLSG